MLCNCVSEYVTYTSHLLTTINGSVNVFIYFFKHKTWIRSSCLSCLLTKGSTNPNRLRVFQSEVVSTFISTRKSSSKEIDYYWVASWVHGRLVSPFQQDVSQFPSIHYPVSKSIHYTAPPLSFSLFFPLFHPSSQILLQLHHICIMLE